MKDLLEKAEYLESKINLKLAEARPFQFFLRNLTKDLVQPDIRLIDGSSLKNFVRSLAYFLKWQLEFRLFKEKFFFDKRQRVAVYLSCLDFFSSRK